MTRLISLGVILGLVVIFGLLSLRVMSTFLLPLLLAAMLVVIFGPMYRALRQKLGVQEWFAAGLTTGFVLIIVLVPLALLVVRAGGDAIAMVKSPTGIRLDPTVLSGLIETINDTTGLELTANEINTNLKKVAEDIFGPIAARAPVVIAKLLIGVIVMTVALFYFLADGARMFAAVTRLIPLDQRYQWQFLAEFEEVSRAVVSSTLLAAIVQAVLAGFGFYVAELQAVFLLTLLTFFGALIPFVGAAAVWGTASLYLLFFAKSTWAALGLALWGGLVVSTVDNIIKPYVLQGQSKLHPLLALLSILGGVAALGPIGIFVGPIAVAFLQAALTMLQTELDTLSDRIPTSEGDSLAGK
ncbi:AI-2E family transporter [Pirellulales bacterium]|nr:AI-2E family transporter [Pirellulales bacterium]MDA7937613.1 AI-2E family transporter [Pirellulales bacterium]MDB4366034.1 AI-2E family transporter [Pirellulales bacterium]MDB4475704.1 AI-2E family transporter [Pirellulales bacterium]